jgi:hypothetical protein
VEEQEGKKDKDEEMAMWVGLFREGTEDITRLQQRFKYALQIG